MHTSCPPFNTEPITSHLPRMCIVPSIGPVSRARRTCLRRTTELIHFYLLEYINKFSLINYNYSHLYSLTFLDICTDCFNYDIDYNFLIFSSFFTQVFLRYDETDCPGSFDFICHDTNSASSFNFCTCRKTLCCCCPIMPFILKFQPSTTWLVQGRCLFIFHVSMGPFWFSINCWT